MEYNFNNKELDDIIEYAITKCNSLNDVCNFLGFKSVSFYYEKIKDVINKRNLNVEHFGKTKFKRNAKVLTDDEWFQNDTNRQGQSSLKRLLNLNLKKRECEKCHHYMYDGEPIELEIHHINGNHSDNRIENLMVLCPICHKRIHKRKKYENKIENLICNKNFTYNKNKVKTNEEKSLKVCMICGNEIKGV